MIDRLEAARAFVAAGDALNSPEHTADMEQLREISNRVTEREKAYRAAQDALFAADCKAVETGAEPAADNAEAEAVLFGQMQQSTLADRVTPRPEDVGVPFDGRDEFSSSRANGAYAED